MNTCRVPWRAALFALLWLLGSPPTVDAQAPVRLRWEAAEADGCVQSSALEEAVEARLRREVFGPARGRAFELEGAWSEGPEGNELRLELRDPRGQSLGTRLLRIDGPCSGLSESLPLVVSLLVEQHRGRIVLYVPPRTERTEPTEPTDRTASIPGPSPRWRFTYALGSAVRGLDAPWPTWTLAQVLRFGPEHFPLELTVEGSVSLPRDITRHGATARVWSYRVGAGLCPRLHEGATLRALTCASLLVGRQHAEGRNLSVNRSGVATTVHLLARAGAELRWGRALLLGASVRGEVALLRADLVIGEPGAEQPLFSGHVVGLGAEVWLGVSFGERRVDR